MYLKKDLCWNAPLLFGPFFTSQNYIVLLFNPTNVLFDEFMAHRGHRRKGWCQPALFIKPLRIIVALPDDCVVIKPGTSPVKTDYEMSGGLFVFPHIRSSSPSQVMHARAGTSVFEGTVPADSHLHRRVTQDSINMRSKGNIWYSLRHTDLTMSSLQCNNRVNKVFK